MTRSGPWSCLGTHGSLVAMWSYISNSGETWKFEFLVKFDLEGQGQMPSKAIEILTRVFCTSGLNLETLALKGDEIWCGQAQNGGKFGFSSWIWPWRSRSIAPQNNRDLKHVLHLWAKFGDPSLNESRVIARTSNWLTHRQTGTHTQTQETTIPDRQNWLRVKCKHSCANNIVFFFLCDSVHVYIYVYIYIYILWCSLFQDRFLYHKDMK